MRVEIDKESGFCFGVVTAIKKAEEELGWKAQFGIKEMCEDAWRWQKNNPNGFED